MAQAEVADAVETVVATSTEKITRYTQHLYDTAARRGQPVIADQGLAGDD